MLIQQCGCREELVSYGAEGGVTAIAPQGWLWKRTSGTERMGHENKHGAERQYCLVMGAEEYCPLSSAPLGTMAHKKQ